MTRKLDSLRTCRGCGCDDLHACPGGCAWVLLDVKTPTGICSVCAQEMDWNQALLTQAICEEVIEVLLRAGTAASTVRWGADYLVVPD